jgi:hypothetical protein
MHKIYRWLKKHNGEVTIEELLAKFPNARPIDIVNGFNKFVDEQLDGR